VDIVGEKQKVRPRIILDLRRSARQDGTYHTISKNCM
jgi:hypothetical protein